MSRFQFAHAGGVRQQRHVHVLRAGGFNSRTRGACDSVLIDAVPRIAEFQFAHAGGVRQWDLWACDAHTRFQFAHAGGVRHPRSDVGWPHLCFNSRTRGACDVSSNAHAPAAPVSIRARGGRATARPRWCRTRTRFNSRTRGACDSARPWPVSSRRCFNSRTRGACDPVRTSPVAVRMRFNSRTRGACDILRKLWRKCQQFQFAHAGGVRLSTQRR